MNRTTLHRLRALLHRSQLERDLDAELDFHRAMAAEHGTPYRFGNELRLREQTREAWMFAWLESLGQDLRYAARSLRRAPGFTASVVIALALGIGANSAIFSLAYAVLWQPLPYPGASRIVEVRQAQGANPPMYNSGADIHVARQQNAGLQDWSLYRIDDATLTGAGEPAVLFGAQMEAGALRALGVKPIAGRLLLPSDDHPGAAPAVMISARLWQQHWNSNPKLIGRQIQLDGKGYTVVGVLPAWFNYPHAYGPLTNVHTSYWRAWQQKSEGFGARDVESIARLAPGVSLAEALKRVNTVMKHIAASHSDDEGWRFALIPMRKLMTEGTATPLGMMLAVVGLVLLIAAANIACLLSARAQRRQHELATRTALGASRSRVLRQLWTETGVLIALGAGLGLALAWIGIAWLRTAAPSSLPRLDHVAMNWPVIGYTAAVAVFVMLGFGLAPAWAATGRTLEASLRPATAVSASTRGRSAWVIAQVALSLVLLTGAGLLLTAFARKRSVPLGFTPAHALEFSLGMPPTRYPKDADRWRFLRAVGQHLTALPGIASAAVVSALPFQGNMGVSYTLSGQTAKAKFDESRDIGFNPVSAGYFQTMQIPVIAGHGFTGADTAAAPAVTVINEEAARTLFPGQNPIGKRIRYDWANSGWRTIVGVVGNVRPYLSDEPAAAPMIAYVPLEQSTYIWTQMTMVLRTAGQPLAVLPEVRRAVGSLDSQVPVAMPQTLRHLYRDALAEPRFRGWLVGGFALLALVLTAVGIFGVLAYSVGGRTRELGVRSALGAQPRQVLAMILRQALMLVGIGLAIGLGLAIAFTRYLHALLYGVSPTNAWILGAVALLMVLVGLAAAWGPARRAMQLDPARALRCE